MSETSAEASKNLVEVQNLHVRFDVNKGAIFKKKIDEIGAVSGVSFSIAPGETLGLVGESGSGKTTTGQAILQITPIDVLERNC
jgi:ABC-type oligopeptide transport system ATPase subunit